MENPQMLDNPQLPTESEVSPWNDIVRYGLIGGLLLIILSLSTIIFDLQFSSLMTSALIGLAVYAIVIIFIVVGVKHHRDNSLGGYISFGRAFVTGTLIGILAALVNQVFNIIYNFIDPGYMERVTETMLEMYEEQGLSEAQLQEIADRMSDPNSLSNIAIGLGMFLIFAAIISLIVAAVLKRERPAANEV
jgi:hypothetical protein